METILFLKKRHSYPDTGGMVVVWEPTALVLATKIEELPDEGLRVTIDRRADVAPGLHIERAGRRFDVDQVEDWLLRGERLVLTCSPGGD
jgi:hypothetical protein